jgi:hypothetical protein
MKTSIGFKRHGFEESDGFYHPDCPVLYADHDTIGDLKDCPFPLHTPEFDVLLFGASKNFTAATTQYGDTKTFAVVEWTKACGHKVQERLPFTENVQTFNHYGTVFEGTGYSIKDWKRRSEFFRNYPCAVCSMVKHGVWIWRERLSDEHRTAAKALAFCLFLLEANYDNWREFVSEQSLRRRFGGPKVWISTDERDNVFTADPKPLK